MLPETGEPFVEIAGLIDGVRDGATYGTTVHGVFENDEFRRAFLAIVPTFPTGYPVRLIGGAFDRWQGIVARLGVPDINRPLVRVFVRPDGEEVEPFEVDLARDSALRLMTAPPKRRSAVGAG